MPKSRSNSGNTFNPRSIRKSCFSGHATKFSDIDLLLIVRADYGALVSHLHPLQDRLGRKINPKSYGRAEWRALVKKGGAFARELLAKPILFVIGSPDDLG